MKKALFVVFLFLSVSINAQYYYRDIVLPGRNTELWDTYKRNGIKKVTLSSQESDGNATEGFSGEQVISSDFAKIITYTGGVNAGSSVLETIYSKIGKISETLDSAQGYSTKTRYAYDAAGRLTEISSQTYNEGQPGDTEKHTWTYDDKGRPASMIRLKNGSEETVITFVLDEKGNVAEENSTRSGKALPSVYYYYDNVNRLTDIVRYSRQAKRLLPDYVFDYDAKGKISSMIVVPEGSDQYQRWVYEYGVDGLKTKEICYDKRKQLLGRIEYTYSK